MQIKRKWQVGAVAAATVAGLAFGIAPAHADPAPGTNPVYDTFGSDTTQDVLNGLASQIKDGSGQPLIASYNAGSGLITGSLRPGETTPVDIPRANGSGQGKTALLAAINNTTLTLNGVTSSGALDREDVDFARSSSEGSWDDEGRLNYVPFAVDAVTYARKAGSATPTNIPLGASVGETAVGAGTTVPAGSLRLTLKNIFSLDATTTLYNDAGTAFTVGNQASGAQIVPFKPQSGSGTLSFFQGEIGGTYGAIVDDKFTYTTVDSAECLANPQVTTGGVTYPTYNASTDICTVAAQEHNGKVTEKVANAIVPFSIAQHLAQTKSDELLDRYEVEVVDRRHGAVLGSVNGIAPVSDDALNTSFPIRRAVFNVVEHDAITAGTAVYDSGLRDLVTNRIPSATAVITDFGFGAIPAGGVSITTQANGTNVYEAGDTDYRSN